MLCGSLDGKGVCGRMDTCLCVVESLHCPPETVTTLLISYTLIQNKKFKIMKKKKKGIIHIIPLTCSDCSQDVPFHLGKYSPLTLAHKALSVLTLISNVSSSSHQDSVILVLSFLPYTTQTHSCLRPISPVWNVIPPDLHRVLYGLLFHYHLKYHLPGKLKQLSSHNDINLFYSSEQHVPTLFMLIFSLFLSDQDVNV